MGVIDDACQSQLLANTVYGYGGMFGAVVSTEVLNEMLCHVLFCCSEAAI